MSTRSWWRRPAAPLLTAAGFALLAHGLGPVSAKPSPVAGPAQPNDARLRAPEVVYPAEADASAEIWVKLKPGDTVDELLGRAGVARDEAETAARLISGALPSGVASGTEVALLLGEASGSDRHLLKRVTIRAGLELKLIVARDGSGSLRLVREDITVDSSPLRFRGRAGSSLYWSLRAAGVPASVATGYLSLLSSRINVGSELAPDDRFDLILSHRRASTGESEAGPLLYAAIDRRNAGDIQLVNWSRGGRSGWFDVNSGSGHSAWERPVAGPVTSHFGTRVHPILRFLRFHSGVDLGAPWGAPIVAASDGHIVDAGWNGGYGRQVRIAHSGGLETSYSHMSQIVAERGRFVQRGQVIGYVGSSGFSTGPHLHYEVHDNGRPVDPLRARHSGSSALSRSEIAAVRARLRELLAVG